MKVNETLFQSFHWYYPADGSLWNHIADQAKRLQELGITYIWLPPAWKDSKGIKGVGYAVYDLYDLGEFNQKGTVRTKYGTKEEYLNCVGKFHEQKIGVIVDVVLNHRLGGDEIEKVLVEEQNPEDRNAPGAVYEQEVYSKYTFPGRQGKYSQFIWDYQSFSGIDDKDNSEDQKKFYKIKNQYGDHWDDTFSHEFGNFDYLLGADVNFRNPAVREEIKHWGEWYYDTVKFDGMRLDAIKHMNTQFVMEWVDHIKQKAGHNLLIIGELWSAKAEELLNYFEATGKRFQLFDVPLYSVLEKASTSGNGFDMRTIFDGTLVQCCPELSITFIENHDTQPLQELESKIEFWFKPIAYALILLREQGMPCVFYSSLYGSKYKDKGEDGNEHEVNMVPVPGLKEMMMARHEIAYGKQIDYFDHPNTIGWIREGVEEKEGSGCAVVLTNGAEGYKDMQIGKAHAGKTFIDVLNNRKEEIVVNEEGWARFTVNGGSVSVWKRK